MRRTLIVLSVAALAGCKAEAPPKQPAPAPQQEVPVIPPVLPAEPTSQVRAVGNQPGAILLTPREYDAALRVVIGDTSNASRQLPNGVDADTNHPFDNLWEQTVVSAPKVDTYETLATEVTRALLTDAPRLQRVLPCLPTSTTDRGCFDTIVTRLGLHALKRPLTLAEGATFSEAFVRFAAQGNDWKKGLEVVLRVLLQHPDFLFRFEVGVPLDDRKTMFALTDYELAAKLSFTLWGEPPPLALLDAAAEGKLGTTEGRERAVDELLADERAADHVARFHAQWLGYSKLERGTEPLDRSLNDEARAMVKRVVFDEDRPWSALVTLDEAWVDSTLAAHYGLSTPNVHGAWVKHSDGKRIGLFGTGAFMAANAGFGDSSVTKRGYNIRKNLFCELVGPPPPDVDISKPLVDAANGSRCKKQIRQATVLRAGTNCLGCHQKMDFIGFGLERYSTTGKWRDHQPDAPECATEEEGEVVGYGTFSGPTALGQLAWSSGRLDRCLVQRWVQFTNRLKGDPNLDALTGVALEGFRQDGKLKGFMRRFVLSDSFRLRSALEQ